MTGEQWIGAADVFRAVHEYDLSQTYVERAQQAGASDNMVRIGLANNYLALGDTARAQGELAAISSEADSEPDYQYLLAEANVLRQEHQGAQALTAFAQASDVAGEDQTAEQALLQAGANEGLRVNSRLSLLSDISVAPVFEDTTVYVLDSKLDATFPVPPSDTSLLPPPRSSLASQGMVAYHLHLNYLPTASGFVQVRNTEGTISVPATNSIVTRNTNDYSFNFGLNPTVHLGTNVLTFNSGVQVTVRRDFDTPVQLNQNLFRVFTYVSTSSFFNLVSVSGFVLREAGPFTEEDLHSATLAGAMDFRVGAPWGKTALVTGWGAAKQTFNPLTNENYYTSSYVGLERQFGERLDVKALVEDLRAWRIVGANSAIARRCGRRPRCSTRRCATGVCRPRRPTPTPLVSTTTMRCRADFLRPMRYHSIAGSRKRRGKFRCSTRYVFRAASSRRVSLISLDRIVSSSGLISISVSFKD